MNLCIVKYREITISETFIRAHAERLPANVTVLERQLPHVGNQPVFSRSIASRGYRKLTRMLAAGDDAWNIARSYHHAFQKFRADAVLAEYGISGVLVMKACKRAGIPLIVHFHGFDISDRNVLQNHAQTYPRLFKEAAAIVSVSQGMRNALVSLGAPEAKIQHNPYGVDCRLFSATNPAANPPTFVAVGRFVEKKAPHLTLLAFSKVHEVFPEARLRMIGDGTLLGPCHDLAAGLGIEGAVTFLGSQPHSVVQDEMRRARAFVQHSLEASNGDSEGTPIGILEAGASGLPVASTRHAGIPEIVVDEETGFLVEERHVDGMAVHMLKLAREPELARRMGMAARRRVETHFSMDQYISRLWSVIESCVASHNSH